MSALVGSESIPRIIHQIKAGHLWVFSGAIVSDVTKIENGENNKNIYSYNDEIKYYLVRVIIQTLDNGLIYIILTEPKYPQFIVKNKTKEIINISQGGQNDFKNIKELKGGIKSYMHKYNYKRFHSSIGYQKPMNVYLDYLQYAA